MNFVCSHRAILCVILLSRMVFGVKRMEAPFLALRDLGFITSFFHSFISYFMFSLLVSTLYLICDLKVCAVSAAMFWSIVLSWIFCPLYSSFFFFSSTFIVHLAVYFLFRCL